VTRGHRSSCQVLLCAVAYAGSAPKDLYGKSITVQWSESFNGKMETEQVARNFGITDGVPCFAHGGDPVTVSATAQR
jgi:hypothetical protein